MDRIFYKGNVFENRKLYTCIYRFLRDANTILNESFTFFRLRNDVFIKSNLIIVPISDHIKALLEPLLDFFSVNIDEVLSAYFCNGLNQYDRDLKFMDVNLQYSHIQIVSKMLLIANLIRRPNLFRVRKNNQNEEVLFLSGLNKSIVKNIAKVVLSPSSFEVVLFPFNFTTRRFERDSINMSLV